MKKFKATITFEVDDNVNSSDVYDMIESDLSSGEFFVKNEEPGDHVKNICVHECEELNTPRKIYCPICGKDEGEVTADVLELPGYVYCHCRQCNETWEMFDPAKKEEMLDKAREIVERDAMDEIAPDDFDADHRKQRGRTKPNEN